MDHHNFFRLVQVNPTSNGGGGGGHGGPGLFTKLRGGAEKELSAELSEVSHNISTISTIFAISTISTISAISTISTISTDLVMGGLADTVAMAVQLERCTR